MKKYYMTLLSIISFILLFAGTIDINALFNYSNQDIPAYINQDNTPNSNRLTDEAATLGRVLFYDTNLSLTKGVSCASCHKQALAFGDDVIQSMGHDGGLTGRHSTRLSSARFGEDQRFFWDERANSLEEQTTMPIQDHVEMGFSGTNGDPVFDSLILRLEEIYYYDELFLLAFGDQTITEERIQSALAQFVRSIQSFDTKYDLGRAQVGNNNANFPNFTEEENNGKRLFMRDNGAGCNDCHRAPEFDIDPDSGNNGVLGVLGAPGSVDLTNERSPSLRDIVDNNGVENGPYMHDGSLATLMDVINHYDDIPNNPANDNLDNRLRGDGGNLNLSDTEKQELLSFLKTLGGTNIYIDPKWSNPFDPNGELEILNSTLPIALEYFDVSKDNEYAVLEWESTYEINVDGFEIMHSSNGTEWEVLDFIIGNNEASFYEYTHTEPSKGVNYYRLKQIDIDGRFNFFDIKSVHFEETETKAIVYPNPTYNFIEINSSQHFDSASLYSSDGVLIQQIQLDGFGRMDLSQLMNGAYILRLFSTSSNEYENRRIVKL